jgi:hypothetical protein
VEARDGDLGVVPKSDRGAAGPEVRRAHTDERVTRSIPAQRFRSGGDMTIEEAQLHRLQAEPAGDRLAVRTIRQHADGDSKPQPGREMPSYRRKVRGGQRELRPS